FGWRARLFAFRRGETEYAIGLLPFGGYVKMAGEELSDPKTGSSDEYASKKPWERALVLVAGAAMNIIFGFLFFLLAYAIGVKVQSSEIGLVAPNGPAWNAGLRAGDRILSLNGVAKGDYTELSTSIALGGLEKPAILTVERDTPRGPERFEVTVRPVRDSRAGMPMIGIEPALRMEVGSVEPGSAAEKGGLRKGDRIEEVVLEDEGVTLRLPAALPSRRRMLAISDFTRSHVGGTVRFQVARAGEATQEITLEVARLDGKSAASSIGIALGQRTIAAVQQGSPASHHFQVGWEVLKLDDQAIHQLDAWSVAAAGEGEKVTFETATGDRGEVSRDDLITWLGEQIIVASGSNEVTSVSRGSTAENLGLKPGDRLVAVGDRRICGPRDLAAASYALGTTISWWDGAEFQQAPLRAVAGSGAGLGVTLASAPMVGRIFARPAPSAGGIRPGDLLREVDGQPIDSWGDFLHILKDSPAMAGKGEEAIEITVERDGRRITVPTTPGHHFGTLGFGPKADQILRQASILDACSLGTSQAVVWAKRVLLTCRALVVGDVSVRNLAGPVGMVHITKEVSRSGPGNLVFILALLSINLGVLNLFPFPILDGGHLLFLAIEKVKGSPVNETALHWAHLVAFVLLISLGIFVTYQDILRLF
ncbi:MAG: RIP metalloprotease RseP, partial [Planctomycetota bacterium]